MHEIAIILGDPHLGKGQALGRTTLGANLNSRIADQVNLLDWTLDRAVEHHASHIIVTGDTFEDPKPHPPLLAIFISWLKKCGAYGVHVHIILGNHDILRSGFIYTSPLDVVSEADLDNVSVYKDVNTILIGTTAFTLMPFRDRKSLGCTSNAAAITLLRDSLVYELASIPLTYQKVLIGHLAIEGSIPVGDELDDIANELYCPLEMFTGYNYTWMGHVHRPQVMQKEPYVAHIGSMDISNFGETEQKKFVVLFDCNTTQDSWSIEYLPTRPLKKLTISVPKDTVDTTQYVLQELKNNSAWDRSIVKVEVALSVPELKSINKGEVEKYLLSQGAHNVVSISESKKIALLKKDDNAMDTKMDVATSIKTYAEKYVEEKIRTEYIELAMEMYATYKSEAKE